MSLTRDRTADSQPVDDRSVPSRAMGGQRRGRTGLRGALGYRGPEGGYKHSSQAPVGRRPAGALAAWLNVIDSADCCERSEQLVGTR